MTLLRDDPGVLGESYDKIVADLGWIVTTWLPAQQTSGPLAGLVDASNVGFAGHSRGGQNSLFALEQGAKGLVKAFFGIDPVDSSQSGSEARTNLPTIGIPTIFLGETTDGGGCAPTADNYQVLYGVAPAPSTLITVVDADHTMFEDPSSCAFCTLCTAGTANAMTVLAQTKRYVTAFFAYQLLGDKAVGATLVGAGLAADATAGLVQTMSK